MSLSRNTVWNLAGAGLPLIVGALTIPYMTDQLGIERFGILTLLWAIIGYFSLFDLGMGRAVTQQVAQSLVSGSPGDVPAIVKLGVSLTLVTGLLGTLVLLAGSHWLAYSGLNVSAELQQETYYSLLIAAAGVPLATVSSGLRGALEGYERFASSNVAKIFLGVSLFLFPVIGIVWFGPGLVGITALLILARLISFVVYLLLALRLPSGNFFSHPATPALLKRLLSFGIWMTLSNLISPVLVNIDRFLISFLLGAAVVAYYTLPFEFLVRLLILPAAIGSALLPRLAKEYSSDPVMARAVYYRGLLVTALCMALVCIVAAAIAYPLMDYFLSNEFAEAAWKIALLLSIGVFVNAIAFLPYTALHSLGHARPVAVLHIIELLVYLPILFIMIKLFGLEGAALAWVLRATIDCVGLFWLYQRRIPGVI